MFTEIGTAMPKMGVMCAELIDGVPYGNVIRDEAWNGERNEEKARWGCGEKDDEGR